MRVQFKAAALAPEEALPLVRGRMESCIYMMCIWKERGNACPG